MKIRTKICGFTRPEDARTAAALGVDAVGLVFYEKSKRFVTVEQARKIVDALPPFVSVVALFVNETEARIREILAQVPIDVIQFHGDETPEFCRRFERPYIKAVRVRSAEDIQTACGRFPDARAVLFDAHVDGEYGGTGKSFDWRMLSGQSNDRWILSGGLTPENVAEAVRITGAQIVDISSGVESVAGVKSAEKMAAFIQNVRQPSKI
ncbi:MULTISPECIES: phosphoribosylanthranilate isomerase [unclassified Neisseria]|uniref:phosphoribosylanthranilate isomerase n=1 Tax=unclassified Neisseria TaxID=2623750 RepID=UPI002666CC6D|nr:MULTISPECIES: phosphoribosylanthranilate isomerase [unclassified Neisseria]MDO1510321.1 phosphoribosylanthranilate isomerase [Neisseria sp. MVDL19-042950]MDO1516490.1 phosphoribosylanthranilate isomerase [Neisseria sp. MVDL18-041461]MDO1563717.1 phosphoribosylanthranilate isomerase [Neisseria sp. MVDL20-010259]